jgi:hypothetical protein
MRKLTDAELSAPTVTLEIPEAQFWRLPKYIRDTLILYVGKSRDGKFIYTIPGYLYREWSHLLTE